MELVVIGLIVAGFFLVAVPWAAFSALGQSRSARDEILNLQSEIASLRSTLQFLQSSPGSSADVETASAPAPPVRIAEPEDLPASPPPAPTAPPVPPPSPIEAEPETPAAAEPEAVPLAARTADTTGEEAPAPPAIEPFRQEAAPQEPRRDFEEAIGSRWAVWVGGVALAFGALFLVRYSIDAGFFGPGVRLAMGAAFAIALAGASEYLRRREEPLPVAASNALTANIPAILAGVSVLAGFGVTFAAHAIYGFIGPGLAFTLMGLIGLAALAASLLHGPALGLFGLVGSYATPFLVSSTAPAFASLSLFVTFVTAVAFLLHQRRPSSIVTLAAVAGHGIWTVLIALAMQGLTWPSFLLVSGSVLALGLIKEYPALRGRPQPASWRLAGFDATSLVAIAVPLILSGVIWVGYGGPGALQIAIIATVLVGIVAAIRHRDLAPLAPLSAAAAAGMVLLWPTGGGALGLSPAILLDLVRLSFGPDAGPGLVWTAALFALIAGALPFGVLLTRSGTGAAGVVPRACLAFASALSPVCLLLATALRLNGLERSLGFAALAALLTVALFTASELILRVEQSSTKARRNPLALIGSAAYASAGAIALGLAVAFALRETWLVVGFAISAAGVAVLASVRPIPLLRTMSAGLATAAFARWLWHPILTDMGSWPILNWIIPAYALPALCFAVGAIALRSRQDRPTTVHQALAVFFGSAFVLLEVRQFFAGPDLMPDVALLAGHYLTPRNALFEEAACQIIAAGLIGWALQAVARRSEGRAFPVGAAVAGVVLIVLGVGGLGGLLNPLFDGTLVLGWPVFNRLLWYVAAGAVLGLLAYDTARRGRSLVGDALSGSAVFLIALGAVLIVRHAFAGPLLAPVDAASVGFYEAVMITIVLLALTAAARLWHDQMRGPVTGYALRVLGIVSIAWAALALGLVRNPLLDQSGVFGVVVFNRILWGYGAVAIGFAATAWWNGDTAPRITRTFRLAAAAAALLGGFLLVRHGFHGAFLASDVPVTLAEAGIYAMLGFAAAIGLLAAGSVTLSGRAVPVRPVPIALASSGIFALLSGLIASPAATGVPLAGMLILDNALVGYLLPALLAFLAALWARAHLEEPGAERILGAAAILGVLVYILIQVRRAYVGPDLLADELGAAELYTYSAAILLYGAGLLAFGFTMRSKDLRLASLGIVTIAICKAFLVDMSGLEGLLRALSFIGLGASLVAIGLAYQKLLRRGEAPGAQPAL